MSAPTRGPPVRHKGEPKTPKENLRGLRGPRVNAETVLNETKITLSLTQLCNIAPSFRSEAVSMIQRGPRPKKREEARETDSG